MLAWPTSGAFVAVAVHLTLLPLKLALAYTIPDVRRAAWRRWLAVNCASSVAWLALLSFAMISCCEVSVRRLLRRMRLPDLRSRTAVPRRRCRAER